MRRAVRGAASVAAVVALAAGLLAVGTAAGSPTPVPGATETSATSPRPGRPGQSVAALQAELDRVPGKWSTWSALGLAYVEQARTTADPTLYDKADGAFARSLELRPDGNDAALTGQAVLAAARHDFAEALALTDRSLAINDYSPTSWAARSDALTELGRYDEALAAVQRLLDLDPGVAGLTRASYAVELRGDVGRARELLEEAAVLATSPADEAFARYHLGELAWHEGDLAAARDEYDSGLAADPESATLLAGRAKVLAATGDTGAAAAEYEEVVERLPAPEFLIAYGELLEATGQTAAAEQQYAVVRAVSQLHAASGQDVDTELALFEADHGTPEAAVAAATAAYEKRPRSVLTQDAYAWALHVAGRSDEALPVARDAARLGLRSASLAYHLGAIEAAAGDPARAREALRRALDLNPTFNLLQAPRARTLLEELGA